MKITPEIIEKAIAAEACVGGVEWGTQNVGNEITSADKAAYILWAYKLWPEEERDTDLFDKCVKANPYPAIKYNSDLLNQEQIAVCIDYDANAMLRYATDYLTPLQIKKCEMKLRVVKK